MQGIDQVTGELYALSPEEFRAARDERAAEARASGDKTLAREISGLRRPVVSAWLVNLLAREAAGQMTELLALGESLRDAQQALDGDRLRELSAQRRELVAAMVAEAKRLAERDGRTVSLQVEREVEGTLQAALADPGAAAAVSAGRLAGPLSYAGLGAGEAVPLRPARPARQEGAPPAQPKKEPAERKGRGQRRAGAGAERGGGSSTAPADLAARRAAREAAQAEAREAAAAERKEREAAAARQAVQDAADVAATARSALDDAERAVASARTEHETVRQRAEQLDRELAEALAVQSRAARAVRDAQRSREVAARALDAATRQLARAEQRASRLGAP